jgi:hypothetical protein
MEFGRKDRHQYRRIACHHRNSEACFLSLSSTLAWLDRHSSVVCPKIIPISVVLGSSTSMLGLPSNHNSCLHSINSIFSRKNTSLTDSFCELYCLRLLHLWSTRELRNWRPGSGGRQNHRDAFLFVGLWSPPRHIVLLISYVGSGIAICQHIDLTFLPSRRKIESAQPLSDCEFVISFY